MRTTRERRRRELLLAAALLAFAASRPLASQVPASERQALIAFHQATNGTAWLDDTGWLGPAGTECTWKGVACTGEGRVFSIALESNGLGGSLPSLAGLPRLRSLVVRGNAIGGPIPSFSGNPELLSLYLDLNQFTGGFPDLSANFQLVDLLLSVNQLSGPIPSLAHLPELSILLLNDNRFSGTLPDLSPNVELTVLNVGANDLTGGVAGLAANAELVDVELGHNQFEGPLPDFTALPELRGFFAFDNLLSGSLPSLANNPALETLVLGRNELSGVIPSLANNPELRRLDLQENRLIGSVPDLSANPELEGLYLSVNQLTGPVPDLTGLPALTQLFLNANELEGPFPDLSGSSALEQLYLDQNRISGVIDLTGAASLQTLNLDGNLLTGPFPDLAGAPNLTGLFLWGNGLTGELPANLPQSSLAALTLELNGLFASDEAVFQHAEQIGFPNWNSSQTVAPGGVTATPLDPTSVLVSWEPISFVAFDGGYRVSVGSSPDGPFAPAGDSADKTVSSLLVAGLAPDTTHYFVVQTFTTAHPGNKGTVLSSPSQVASTAPAATSDVGSVTLAFDRYVAVEGEDKPILVRRLGGASGQVSVTLELASISASPGADFSPLGGTLTWQDGDAHPKELVIEVGDDGLPEGEEHAEIRLRDPAGGATLGELATATLVLNDKDLSRTDSAAQIFSRGGSPATAADPNGGRVVVWTAADSSGQGILGQRFDPAGLPVGSQFQVNQITAGDQKEPAVAVDSTGGIVVAWSSSTSPASGATSVVARRFDPNGVPAGGETLIRQAVAAEVSEPTVTRAPSGEFFVAWREEPLAAARWLASGSQASRIASGSSVLGRAFTANGQPTATAPVTVTSDPEATAPAAAYNEEGEILVVWSGASGATANPGQGRDILGRTFDPAGQPKTAASRINQLATGQQSAPAVVAVPGSGEFAVVWQGDSEPDPETGTRAPGGDVFVRRVGAATTPETRVNANVSGAQLAASVAASSNGDCVVGWQEQTSTSSVVARAFPRCASLGGPEVVVASGQGDAAAGVRKPKVAFHANDGVTVAFGLDDRNEGDGGIAARAVEMAVADGCAAGSERLCLTQNRFAVDVAWRNGAGATGAGQAVALTADTGYFWFFDDDNVELVIKVLDACVVNQRFWVFAGGLTDVEVELRITDVDSGQVREYVNPLGSPFEPILDTGAFATCGAGAVAAPDATAFRPGLQDVLARTLAAEVRHLAALPTEQLGAIGAGACATGDTALCLAADRFRVTLGFTTPQGQAGTGQAVSLTADTGYFWFFDDDNVEMVVKVLDACVINQRFWVFAGGLTDVGAELRVEDTMVGTAKTYQNPVGVAFRPILDTSAFATCGAAGTLDNVGAAAPGARRLESAVP